MGWRWCFGGSHVGFAARMLDDLKRPLVSNSALQMILMAV
jgi:hypothetical protein